MKVQSSSRRCVLINQSSGYLMVDIANAYAKEYDEVVLMAGCISKTNRPLTQDVRVSKLIAYNRSSALKRILTWFISFVQILFKVVFKYRKYELVYVTNPPMSYLVSLFVRNPFSVIVFDSYPDALRNIGIKQGHWLYELWSKWNRKLFTKARIVYTLSEGMANQLTAYVNRNHIKVVSLWPSSESFYPISKINNPFVRQHGMEEKFVVMYSGNMGYTHSVDVLVEVAKRLQSDDNIHFLFIGDGKKKSDLISSVVANKLTNCTFLDWQPVDILPYSLASADIGVVTLNDETALTSVPSKSFNLMAVGAPLLCIAPKHSEIATIIHRYKNGVVCPANEIDSIVGFIVELSRNDELKQSMSDNSLQAAKAFTKDNAFMYLPQIMN